MAKKSKDIIRDILDNCGSGSLGSTLGRNDPTISTPKSKPYAGETKRQFQERIWREERLRDEMERDPSRDGYGRRHPVRYDE